MSSNLFWFLLGGFPGLFMSIVINSIIDEYSLSQGVKQECPEAFKLLIKEKKKQAVQVGIFDRQNSHMEDMEITSTKGVDRNLRKGQVIYV